MSPLELNKVTEAADSRWNWLYRLGGAAGLIMVAIIPLQVAIFIVSPPPSTVVGWFTLFQKSTLLGLLSFEVLFVVYGALSIPMSLALYVALRRTSESFTALYLALTVAGVAALFVARPAFDMLYLSHQYAAATNEAQRSVFLAAGEAMLAVFHGTAFHVSYVLGSLNGLIISGVMLKSSIFSKATAYVRILSSVLDFAIYVPTIGIFISIFSVVLLAIWNILVARRLFQLGQRKPARRPDESGQPVLPAK
jgi:hypothetical protein